MDYDQVKRARENAQWHLDATRQGGYTKSAATWYTEVNKLDRILADWYTGDDELCACGHTFAEHDTFTNPATLVPNDHITCGVLECSCNEFRGTGRPADDDLTELCRDCQTPIRDKDGESLDDGSQGRYCGNCADRRGLDSQSDTTS